MAAGDEAVVAEFPFKNDGATPVVITDLKSSCGCSTPTVESRTIGPGKSGTLKVNYVPGDRVGPQSARITVSTDEAGKAADALLLKVDIRPVLTFAPRLVQWLRTGSPEARVIKIKREADSANIISVQPEGDAIAAELKDGDEAGTWLLELTPRSLEDRSTTKVHIQAESDGRKSTYTVFAVVR